MGKDSKIEWTHHTFNPWWGCIEVSPGCDNCYAKAFAKRVGYSENGSQFPIWGKGTERRLFGDAHWAEPRKWNEAASKAGERRRVFCGSMCDVMEEHPGVWEQRFKLFLLIQATPWLDWLLLTKRPQNFRRFLPDSWLSQPRPNVWGMTSVESEKQVWRVQDLVDTPFAVRCVSYGPALGLVDWMPYVGDGTCKKIVPLIDQIIVEGESGHGARPFNIDWARQTVSQCQAASVSVFVKQLGARPFFRPCCKNPACDRIHSLQLKDKKGGDMDEWPADLRVREVPGIGTL